MVCTAGTADLPVAEEVAPVLGPKVPPALSCLGWLPLADSPPVRQAAVTAELMGVEEVVRVWDVGVAGIQRLLRNRELINVSRPALHNDMHGAGTPTRRSRSTNQEEQEEQPREGGGGGGGDTPAELPVDIRRSQHSAAAAV